MVHFLKSNFMEQLSDMEQYDENVLKLGCPPDITNIKDAETIHIIMVDIETKARVRGCIYDMPHYRGEQKFGWDILPSIFRIPSLENDPEKAGELQKKAMIDFDETVTELFGKDALRTLFYSEKHGKDWDLLFQAQHANIKTKLLDWSPEILTALFFCTEESQDPNIEKADGQLWVFMVPFENIKAHNEFPVKDTFYEQDPSTIKDGFMINSSIYLDNLGDRVLESRMYKQRGRFYISSENKSYIPLNKQPDIKELLFRFKVPFDCKPIIREELRARKISREYLYVQENSEHQAIIDLINSRVYKF